MPPRSARKQLVHLAAQHAVERKLALRCAAQFKEQLTAIVGHRVHGIHQPHARIVVKVGGIGYILEQHKHVSVEVGLRHQGYEFLLGARAVGVEPKAPWSLPNRRPSSKTRNCSSSNGAGGGGGAGPALLSREQSRGRPPGRGRRRRRGRSQAPRPCGAKVFQVRAFILASSSGLDQL